MGLALSAKTFLTITNKTIKTITSILLVFQSLFSFAQVGPDDVPCEARRLNDFTQISDSIEFRLNCWTQIDFEDEMCTWSLAEDYFNTVPSEKYKTERLSRKIETEKIAIIIYVKKGRNHVLKTEEEAKIVREYLLSIYG